MDKKELMTPMTLKEVLMCHKYETGGHIDLHSMEKRFIRKYKHLPHLWNPNHPDYNNKLKRNAGYDALMPIFRQYMPRATRFHIRQKINILRSCYRKDRRKYLASRNIDLEGNVIYSYVPHSWKYNALRFLDDDDDDEVDNKMDVLSEIETCPEYEDEQELAYVETESGNEEPDTSKMDMTPIYLEEEHLEDHDNEKLFKINMKRDTYSYSDQTVQSYMEGKVLEKEFNAIGANVACKLQRMSLQQRYHAELLINKVLIKGLKESLTEATDLTSNWENQLEDSISYSRINESNTDDYQINTNSKEDSREEMNNSDEISEDK